MEKILEAWDDINTHDVKLPRAFDAESGWYTYDDGLNAHRLKQAQEELLIGSAELFYDWLERNGLLLEAVEVIRKNLEKKNDADY